jgi:hypothetical protein
VQTCSPFILLRLLTEPQIFVPFMCFADESLDVIKPVC